MRDPSGGTSGRVEPYGRLGWMGARARYSYGEGFPLPQEFGLGRSAVRSRRATIFLTPREILLPRDQGSPVPPEEPRDCAASRRAAARLSRQGPFIFRGSLTRAPPATNGEAVCEGMTGRQRSRLRAQARRDRRFSRSAASSSDLRRHHCSSPDGRIAGGRDHLAHRRRSTRDICREAS